MAVSCGEADRPVALPIESGQLRRTSEAALWLVWVRA